MGPLRDRTVQRVSLPESGFGFEIWTGFRHADEFHVGLETDRVGNAFADGSVSVHPQTYLDLRSIGQTHTISVNYGWEIDYTASNLLGDRLGGRSTRMSGFQLAVLELLTVSLSATTDKGEMNEWNLWTT